MSIHVCVRACVRVWGCAGPIPSISRLKPRSINGGMSDVSSDYPSIDIRARYCTLGSAVQCDSLSLPGLCVACVCVYVCVCGTLVLSIQAQHSGLASHI